ncbi:tRNA delta(2)-isopentenylpyrophosphate transferase [Bordetella pertussis]|nr:tRNA delta(2)-isopentenylpyrophosphate transferase [Bordetella pertussis]
MLAAGLVEEVRGLVAATRQLAKRQLTWLRAQPERVIIDCLAGDAVARTVDAMARALPD